MSTFKLIIKGKVQGVFYRATAKKKAEKTGIKGWVQNTEEGNVEVMLTGSNEQVQEFIKWCKKGPAQARVNNVIVIPQEEMVFDKFEIVK